MLATVLCACAVASLTLSGLQQQKPQGKLGLFCSAMLATGARSHCDFDTSCPLCSVHGNFAACTFLGGMMNGLTCQLEHAQAPCSGVEL